MITAVIIDDELSGREVILEMMNSFFSEIKILGMADSVESGAALINNVHPNLVFLDIKMPDGSGFDLIKKVSNRNFEVIFVTAFDNYAVSAFQYAAVYYLLKPIQKIEFSKAVELARDQINLKKENLRLNFLLDRVDARKQIQQKIVLPTMNGFDIVTIADIIRCESEINYTRFYLTTGRALLVSKTLREFENVLCENNFFRIHRSHIINLNHVTKYIRGKGGEVLMSDGSTVDVSREKKEEFLRVLSGY